MKRLLKFILPILTLGLGLGIYQRLQDTRAAPEPLAQALQPPAVDAMLVKRQNLAPELKLFGRIETPTNSVLGAGITADVTEVSVQEGDTVRTGDVLVRLDDTNATLNVLQKKARVAEIKAQANSDQQSFRADQEALEREQAMLALTRKGVARARKLASANAGTEATLDEVLRQEEQLLLAIIQRKRAIDDYESRQDIWKARMDNAGAALGQAEYDLSRTLARAPYGGRIIELYVSPGDRATIGKPLVRMFDHLNLEIRAQAPSRYIPALRTALEQGREILALLNHGQEKVRVKLDRLAAVVAEGKGGVDVFFRAEADALPAPGSTVQLTLRLPVLQNVIALPQDAIYGNNLVYRITGNRLQSLTIRRLGQNRNLSGQPQMIVDGSELAQGDLVMVSRLSNAIDGLVVEPDIINE